MRQTLEHAFNFEFKNFNRKIHEIFRRKPFNLTKALDYMRSLLIWENRNRSKQKMKNNKFIDA